MSSDNLFPFQILETDAIAQSFSRDIHLGNQDTVIKPIDLLFRVARMNQMIIIEKEDSMRRIDVLKIRKIYNKRWFGMLQSMLPI